MIFISEVTRQRPEERHLLCTKIYLTQKTHVTTWAVSTYAIDIWWFYIIRATKHLSELMLIKRWRI